MHALVVPPSRLARQWRPWKRGPGRRHVILLRRRSPSEDLDAAQPTNFVSLGPGNIALFFPSPSLLLPFNFPSTPVKGKKKGRWRFRNGNTGPIETSDMARARLSMAFEDVRGRMGQSVVSRTQGGLVTKRLPKYKYPKIPAVEQGAERMRQANAAWNELTLAQAQAWQGYAETLFRTDPITGTRYAMSAKSAFIALTTKLLQMHPSQPIPAWPPLDGFIGDGVGLEVSSPHSHVVRFSASGPNSPGVVTELMVQKLANVRRSPSKFYKSLVFHAFEPGALTLDVTLDPGVYAFAYRFVRATTGQMTPMVGLGTVEVL